LSTLRGEVANLAHDLEAEEVTPEPEALAVIAETPLPTGKEPEPKRQRHWSAVMFLGS
jgi:hypothetical protein